MISCFICSSDKVEWQCACQKFGYCSMACQAQHLTVGHGRDCAVLAQAVSIGETKAQQQLYSLLSARDPLELTPTLIKAAFASAYPPRNFPYLVQHYDRCDSQKLLPLDDAGRWAMASFTSMQRLLREYLGPWSKKRGHIISAPTGAGKTVIGHAVAGNYRYERVTLTNPVANDAEATIARHRTILYVTRTTLVRDVKKALWAQTSANLAAIHKRTKEASVDVFEVENPAPFSTEVNVVSFKTFTNMLSGSNPQGRRLWAGLPINARDDPKLKGYRAAPNAYRLVGNAWVRGKAPHSLASKTSDVEYDLVLVWRRGTFSRLQSGGDSLLTSFAAKLAKEWNKKARRSSTLPEIQNSQAVLLGGTASPRIYITARFKDNRPLPLPEEWANWASDSNAVLAPETAANKSKAYAFFQSDTERLLRLEPGIKEGGGPTGYALRRRADDTLVWETTNEPERDFNPLDALTIILDEADMAFDPSKVKAGERANAQLLETAARESKGMVVMAMSATIDLYALLGLSRTIIPQAPGGTLVPTTPYADIPAILDARNLTWSETIEQLGDLFDRERGTLNERKLAEIETALRGSVSAMTVDKMLDLFPKFDAAESRQVAVLLGARDSSRLVETFASRPKLSASRLAHSVAFTADVYEPEWRLGSAVFDVNAVAEALVRNTNDSPAHFPVAMPLLEALKHDDEEEAEFYAAEGLTQLRPAKRVIISSLESDEGGVIPAAAALQAAGYQWLPIVRQETKLKRLQLEVFQNPGDRSRQDALRALKSKLAEQRRLGTLADKHKTVRILQEQPFTMRDEALAKEVGPQDSRRSFLVLSTSLSWDRDPTLREPNTAEELLDAALASSTFDTKFVFVSAKQLRDRLQLVLVPGESDDAHAVRETLKRDTIRTIKDHKVYLWPGSTHPRLNADLFSRDDIEVLTRRFGELPGFFIRKVPGVDDEEEAGRALRYLEPYPVYLEEFGIGFANGAFAENINRLKRIAEFNTRLSREEMLDAADIVQRLWNSDANVQGEVARFIIVSNAFNQGVDLNGATRAYNLEPTATRSSELQRRGRYIRRCSAAGLRYPEQWQVRSTTFVATLDATVRERLTYGAVMSRPQRRADDFEDEDEDEESGFRRHRKERGVIQSIEVDPMQALDAPPYGDPDEVLQLYHAVRLRTEDPSVAALRLEGAPLLSRWAIDARHNEIGLDSDADRRFAFTNYRIIKSALIAIVQSLPAPEPLPTEADFERDPVAATETVKRRARAAGKAVPDNVSMFAVLTLLGELRTQESSGDVLAAYFNDLIDQFGDDSTLLIIRRLAEDADERNLFVSAPTSRAPLRRENGSEVMLDPTKFAAALSNPGWKGGVEGFLRLLVQERLAIAAPIFRSLSENVTARPKRKGDGGGSSGGSKRTKTDDEDEDEDEEEDFAAEFTLATAICNDLIGQGDENDDAVGVSVGSELESPAVPDQEQQSIEDAAAVRVRATLEIMHLWHSLEGLSAAKYAARILRAIKAPASRAEKITTLKAVLVDLYSRGLMNWNLGVRLLHHALDHERGFGLKELRETGKLVGRLFQLAFYEADSFMAQFLAWYELPDTFFSEGKTPAVLAKFAELLAVWALPYEERKSVATFNLPLTVEDPEARVQDNLVIYLQDLSTRLYLDVPSLLFRASKPLGDLILRQTEGGKSVPRDFAPSLLVLASELLNGTFKPQLRTDGTPERYADYLRAALENGGDFELARIAADPGVMQKRDYARLLQIERGAPDLTLSTQEMLHSFVLVHRDHVDVYPFFNSAYAYAQRVLATDADVRDVIKVIVAALPDLDEGLNEERWRDTLLLTLQNRVGLANYRETGFRTKRGKGEAKTPRYPIVLAQVAFRDFAAEQPFYIVDGRTPARLSYKNTVVETLYEVYRRLGYEYRNEKVELLPESFVTALVDDLASMLGASRDVVASALDEDGAGALDSRQRWARLVARYKRYKRLVKAVRMVALEVPSDDALQAAFRKLLDPKFDVDKWAALSEVLGALELGPPSRYVNFDSTRNITFQRDPNADIARVLVAIVEDRELPEKRPAEQLLTRYTDALLSVHGGTTAPRTRRQTILLELTKRIRDHIASPPPGEAPTPNLKTLMVAVFDAHVTSVRRALLEITATPPLLPEPIVIDAPAIKFDVKLRCQECGATPPRVQYCACNKPAYCNAACQRRDWARHKSECTYMRPPQ